ncbi:hypothetical protein MMC13_000311 [Lambiella insularis]|nr:hypothetical protein [Lambiella insularis]
MSSTPPAKAIPLLLLKTPSTPHDGYRTHFTQHAPPFAPQFIPVLQHLFLPAALSQLRILLTTPTVPFPYGGLICTSQRAVEALGTVLSDATRSPPPLLQNLAVPLYTVGPATSRALTALRDQHLPRCSVHGREAGNGANLAAYILQHYPPSPSPAPAPAPRPPLLFLVGETRRDVIPVALTSSTLPAEQRIPVDELVVYETRVVERFGGTLGRTLRGLDEAGERVRWIVVFSPAGCAEMVRALRERGEGGTEGRDRGEETGSGVGEGEEEQERSIFVASIGPTTRDYLLQEFGFRVDVCADQPSPEGLAEGIERFMKERGLRAR